MGHAEILSRVECHQYSGAVRSFRSTSQVLWKACFNHGIKKKKCNCDFLSHNSEIFFLPIVSLHLTIQTCFLRIKLTILRRVLGMWKVRFTFFILSENKRKCQKFIQYLSILLFFSEYESTVYHTVLCLYWEKNNYFMAKKMGFHESCLPTLLTIVARGTRSLFHYNVTDILPMTNLYINLNYLFLLRLKEVAVILL